MKKIFALALAATTFAATPALAQTADGTFTGPRVGAVIGAAGEDFGGFDGSFTYGANVGYDVDLGGAVVGGTLEYQDSDDDAIGRDLAATLRVGGKLGDRALIYALGGYTNLSANTSPLIGTDIKLDGYRLGAGLEFAVTPNVFVTIEERYSNYELDVDGFQTIAGVGFRF